MACAVISRKNGLYLREVIMIGNLKVHFANGRAGEFLFHEMFHKGHR
jgi:hypothetical protein